MHANVKWRRMIMIMLSFVIYHSSFSSAYAQGVVDDVIWVVGDEPILRSDV